jgi:hypothetical protein
MRNATTMIEGELLVMQDHLTYEGEEKQEKEKEVEVELIENKESFFDSLEGLEVARKYIQQLNVKDDILVHAVSSKTSSMH